MKQFEKYCRRLFKPVLEDKFRFKIVDVKHTDFSDYLIYQNATTGIKISYEPREGGIFVLLSRLIDGKMPEYPIYIKADTILNSFDLEDIISFKLAKKGIGHKFKNYFRKYNFNRKASLVRNLTRYAEELEEHAAYILNGDFGDFPELEKIVKARGKLILKS
jgi:hypothetical protein